MKVENWRTDRLVPYDRNPRDNAGAVDKVAASIQEFGFRQPIVELAGVALGIHGVDDSLARGQRARASDAETRGVHAAPDAEQLRAR